MPEYNAERVEVEDGAENEMWDLYNQYDNFFEYYEAHHLIYDPIPWRDTADHIILITDQFDEDDKTEMRTFGLQVNYWKEEGKININQMLYEYIFPYAIWYGESQGRTNSERVSLFNYTLERTLEETDELSYTDYTQSDDDAGYEAMNRLIQ